MKKIIAILFTLLFATSITYAQMFNVKEISERLTTGITIHNDIWAKMPDSVKNRAINQGFEVFTHYHFKMTKSGSIAFFLGGSISSHNLFLKNAGFGYNSEKEPYMYNIPEKIGDVETNVRKSKLSFTYVDIPLGFNFKIKKDFHATAGFSIGWNIQSQYKYKGKSLEDLSRNIKYKNLNLEHTNKMRYGPFVILGYKGIGLKAAYQIVPSFQENKGLDIYPITLGIVFKPYYY
ncbi:MAG: outer membrane beta-barrel protein [Lentimicrobiaceae bacterium]|nr:outer membrane beta-barrel protein [Lentimicrobiaceae bacterium]